MTAPVRHAWTMRRRLGQAFAVLSAVVAVLLAIVVVSTVVFVRTGNRLVNRWDPAVTTTQRLLTDLVDEETAVRGYALTKDRAHVSVYDSALKAQHDDRATLDRLTGDDAGLAPKLAALGQAADTWQRDIAEPSLRGVNAGNEAAGEVVAEPRARALFDRIRSRAATLSDAVADEAASARETRRTALTVFVVALCVAAGIVVLAGVGLWRALHHWVLGPVDRLRRQTREVAGGDTYRHIEADGPSELTELGGDVEAMRLQIAGQLARAQETQEELRLRGEELARSNEDLQQFAYVASHDLSEPLRKVANFCQLLERQYGPQLDDRARQYIDFAVDGAKRMQRLISDLLALSRVGRTTEQFVPVDLDAAFDDVVANLADPIAEAKAQVQRLTPLPTVAGDRSLLTSLLDNLIGNAVKYCREDVPPVVQVRAEDEGEFWNFTVQDNGIGIDPEYAERIFVVFQRLHLRDHYGGTGIGLALCRKIVEFHGGRIWLAHVESSPGATFRFTLPKGGLSAEPRH